MVAQKHACSCHLRESHIAVLVKGYKKKRKKEKRKRRRKKRLGHSQRRRQLLLIHHAVRESDLLKKGSSSSDAAMQEEEQRLAGQPDLCSRAATLDQTLLEPFDIMMDRPSPCIVL
ncbi:unnamed protein product [Pleuronectes platessa]|uniref:Uncharacterized protein n=1 Tax=Pleuronectes platessa TaxID=8262 RepID=A0A9N7U4E6_PLEPL|nr:unnamed protein product [Pleuronectes platessa]